MIYIGICIIILYLHRSVNRISIHWEKSELIDFAWKNHHHLDPSSYTGRLKHYNKDNRGEAGMTIPNSYKDIKVYFLGVLANQYHPTTTIITPETHFLKNVKKHTEKVKTFKIEVVETENRKL